jgi:hypothetical protein
MFSFKIRSKARISALTTLFFFLYLFISPLLFDMELITKAVRWEKERKRHIQFGKEEINCLHVQTFPRNL